MSWEGPEPGTISAVFCGPCKTVFTEAPGAMVGLPCPFCGTPTTSSHFYWCNHSQSYCELPLCSNGKES